MVLFNVQGTKTVSRLLMRLLTNREKNRLSSDLAHLEKKGYTVIHSSLNEMDQFLRSGPQTVYCGFDPTASSLHVGNLLALIGLIHFQRLGHQPIALVGGATALIGDPTHRSVERERLEREAANENAKKIAETIAAVFENHEREFWNCDSNESNCLPPLKPPIIVNNQDWYSSTNVIDFLHETGRHFRMNSLLGRSSVKDRMESQDGMSLTEFLYQVFQSHDWLHLYQKYGCRIQLGGNDQTGNIMSGFHLIHKVLGTNVSPVDDVSEDVEEGVDQGVEKLFGVTVPILTSETTGLKIGKSSGGHSLWLREELTSPFELYQYFYNVWDKESLRFLRQLTFLSEDEISSLLGVDTSERAAQKTLAQHVVRLLHGQRGVDSATRCTNALFGASLEDLKKLTAEEVVATFPGAGVLEMKIDRSDCFSSSSSGACSSISSSSSGACSSISSISDALAKDDTTAVITEQTSLNNDSDAVTANQTCDYPTTVVTPQKLTLVDLVLATRHCQRMILAKRPNFKPEIVENMAKTSVLRLISEGAVKINFDKMFDPDFHDFDSCVLTADCGDKGAASESMSSWSLLTVAKKHQYIVKWVAESREGRTFSG